MTMQTKEIVDYAEEFLKLKDREQWHKYKTYIELKDSSEREKAQFNDFVKFKVKQGREQGINDIEAIKITEWFMRFYKDTKDLYYEKGRYFGRKQHIEEIIEIEKTFCHHDGCCAKELFKIIKQEKLQKEADKK